MDTKQETYFDDDPDLSHKKLDKNHYVSSILQHTHHPQQPQRICLIPIQSNWSIFQQLLFALALLATLIFAFVVAIVFLNLYLTKDMLISSSHDSILQQVHKAYLKEAEIQVDSFFADLDHYAKTASVANLIFLSALYSDNTLFEFDLSKVCWCLI